MTFESHYNTTAIDFMDSFLQADAIHEPTISGRSYG